MGKCLGDYLLEVQWATATIEDDKPGESDPSDYDEINTTKEAKTTDDSSSQVIHVKMRMVHMGGDQCDDSDFYMLRMNLYPKA